MRTTLKKLEDWFKLGVEHNSTFMIVAHDTFDFIEYPIYIDKPECLQHKINNIISNSKQGVLEVFDLTVDLYKQIQIIHSEFDNDTY